MSVTAIRARRWTALSRGNRGVNVAPGPTLSPEQAETVGFDPAAFLLQLADVGIDARVETEVLGFAFASFAAAWEALARVTTAHLEADRRQEAQAAILAALYPDGDGPRHFRNETQFIIGMRRGE